MKPLNFRYLRAFCFQYFRWISVGIAFVFFGWLFFPLRSIMPAGFLFESHLIAFTNEAEQRPCGGFLTAFAEVSFFPPRLILKNSYDLNHTSLGEAPEDLKTVTNQLYFWDTTISPDLNTCTKQIQTAYKTTTYRAIDRVWLVNTNVLTDIIATVGPIKSASMSIDSQTFFPMVSRQVAHADRHDEKAILERKEPLKQVLKDLLRTITLKPFAWHRLFETISQSEKKSDLFIQNKSKNIVPNKDQIRFIEWNLGGGKTSKSLWQSLDINARETSPSQWEFSLSFTAKNLSGNDEPLGQNWQGKWDMYFPEVWKLEPETHSVVIKPGQEWFFEKKIRYEGDVSSLEVFVPRGQILHGSFQISVYPQQILVAKDFKTFNNTGFGFKTFETGSNIIHWEVEEDRQGPFLTMHKPVAMESLSAEVAFSFKDSSLVVEVHTNEKIQPDLIQKATLIDRDYALVINENTENNALFVFPDQTTLLLGFSPKTLQENERFYLEIDALIDVWGNPQSVGKNTVIIRP